MGIPVSRQGGTVSRAVIASKTAPSFDPKTFLSAAGMGRTVVNYRKNSVIFSQGDVADAVFYVHKGRVKLAVVSERGREAVVRLPAAGEFFGEGCLAGQTVRIETATTISDCSLLKIRKQAMVRALHEQQELSDFFVSYLVSRNIRYEEDLVDQLFNSSEKRLARILLLLANFGKEDRRQRIDPKISQETLAQMVGTTRSRVNFFMNRFRKLGFVEYNDELEVHSSLLNVVLYGRTPLPRSLSAGETAKLLKRSKKWHRPHIAT
jgi:CRP/FNR family transcriptional regulator, cyclic AMP receptor protein